MKEVDVKINLPAIDSVKTFTSISMQFKGEVDLISGRHAVDGKSIMGIFSLDLSKPIDCHINGEPNDVDAFLTDIKSFTV